MPTLSQFVHRYSVDEGHHPLLMWPPAAIVVTDGRAVRVIGDDPVVVELRRNVSRRFRPGVPEDVLIDLTHRIAGYSYNLPTPRVDSASLPNVVDRLLAEAYGLKRPHVAESG